MMAESGSVRVGDREIGRGHPVFLIAEAGVNHDGIEERAHRLVDAAADAGADAVKFQTFDPRESVIASERKARYQERTTGAGSQREMLERLVLPEEAQQRVAMHSASRGLIFLSTPSDRGSVDVVVRLGVPAIKVSSADLTNVPLLRYMGSRGLPVLLSTGMADLVEVGVALSHLRASGAPGVALLHCVSAYPAPPDDVNLRAMALLEREFAVPVGYSDHTVGIGVPLAAVALGATVIEKHFTLDRTAEGPDHAASIEPDELGLLVAETRKVERALGRAQKGPAPSEAEGRRGFRKSIVARRELTRGAVLGPDDLAIKRPGDGITPEHWDEVVGRRLKRTIVQDEQLRWEDLD
jgi:N-acetylneuraminate synthase/N,N'-diacetyllegionaminate synthase